MIETAFVTGGSGGIGSQICQRLAEKGFLVAVGYNSGKQQAEETVQKITQLGYTARAVHCDISSLQSIKQAVEEISTQLGKITLLVNNGGIADINLFNDLSHSRLDEIMEVNLLGAMRLTREILPEMLRNHRGNIINISSVWGEKGASCEVAYSTAKAGIIGFTKALARECAPNGIRVNCVSCGLIDTKMNANLPPEELTAVVEEIPAGRMGTPQDVANAVLFLAEEKSDYINGQVIRVDGCWI